VPRKSAAIAPAVGTASWFKFGHRRAVPTRTT
jgi:hypothetical protein